MAKELSNLIDQNGINSPQLKKDHSSYELKSLFDLSEISREEIFSRAKIIYLLNGERKDG